MPRTVSLRVGVLVQYLRVSFGPALSVIQHQVLGDDAAPSTGAQTTSGSIATPSAASLVSMGCIFVESRGGLPASAGQPWQPRLRGTGLTSHDLRLKPLRVGDRPAYRSIATRGVKKRGFGGPGVNRGKGRDWNRCIIAKGVALGHMQALWSSQHLNTEP